MPGRSRILTLDMRLFTGLLVDQTASLPIVSAPAREIAATARSATIRTVDRLLMIDDTDKYR